MRFSVLITGLTPLLVHGDPCDFSDDAVEKKKGGHPGDDRDPADKWKSYLLLDAIDQKRPEALTMVMPTENVNAALMFAGGKMKGSGRGSLKSESQSVMWDLPSLPLLVAGKTVTAEQIKAIDGSFDVQRASAQKLGFDLWPKRCVVQQKRHVRVRPKLARWSCSGACEIDDADLSEAQFRMMFEIAGRRSGLGDWRPSAKKPGPYGKFEATIKKL